MELTKVAIALGLTLMTILGGMHYMTSQQADSIADLSSLEVSDIKDRLPLFRDWMIKYNKNYGAIEAVNRFAIWSKTYDVVQAHNEKNLSWDMETNQFADLTNEEFAAIYLGYRPSSNRVRQVTYLDENEVLSKPSTGVDWRNKSAVTAIKNQGQCGSCYTFSTTAALEALNAIKGGTLTSFSEQQLVDCSTSYGNQGCSGGLMDNCFKYVADKGIEKESDYAYTGQDKQTCKYSANKAVYKNKNYTDVPVNNPTQLKAAVNQQVVSIAVEADQDAFKNYKSGVITDNCGTDLDHGIAIVGFASNYWIVRNSWGTSWGEQGYLRIAQGTQNDGKGVCGINSDPSYPTA